MILEGILTTVSPNGTMHVAPMGPDVDESFSQWTLKPFQTSETFKNLRRENSGVFHVIDDPLLLARAVLGLANDWPAQIIEGGSFVLDGACRWYALKISQWNLDSDRAMAIATVSANREVRSFFGWNRAKHAIVEIAILASRVRHLPATLIIEELSKLRTWVTKTGGPRECEAMELLQRFIQEHIDANPGDESI